MANEKKVWLFLFPVRSSLLTKGLTCLKAPRLGFLACSPLQRK